LLTRSRRGALRGSRVSFGSSDAEAAAVARAPELTQWAVENAYLESTMLNRDGEDHRRLRLLVSKAFTLRRIELLRPRIQEIANALIDPAAPLLGEMDLMSAYAFPLPITVIAELLGVPPSERDGFQQLQAATADLGDPDAELPRKDWAYRAGPVW
jgi:cytochrome P450